MPCVGIIEHNLRQALQHIPILVLYFKIPTRFDPTRPLEYGCVPQDLHPGRKSQQSQTPDFSMENCTIFYIGGECLGLANLLMTHSSCEVHLHPSLHPRHYSILISKVYSYDPRRKTARLESTRTNRLLMRRYAVVQRARDADVFGILVGTLAVGLFHISLPYLDISHTTRMESIRIICE
jgi:diphthamide biosynthesis protein 2